ncbi:hypothetical protein GCM10009798_15850 [Nocardioides panacihumi]|uniref:PIN domain-containing protein n=1 Tax=Nocardioides panacihumi TaxID=400774 RepID=A0ABP5C6K5_9ACTN
MARYAIDALTLLRLVDDGLAADPAHQIVAPKSILVEGLDILLDDVRNGRRKERDALRCHVRMTETRIRLLGDRVSRRTAWDLALEHGWASVREAEYVAVATLQADALVASDPALASRAAGIVALATAEDLIAT